ncbi:hypothetical protein ACEN88_28595 [Massilia sp. CT11-108]|uniref:hypothetical protein n=1 Tax=Massilia sp. CT11-108 TaxID=3393900 RepID=UPI0039A6F723
MRCPHVDTRFACNPLVTGQPACTSTRARCAVRRKASRWAPCASVELQALLDIVAGNR